MLSYSFDLQVCLPPIVVVYILVSFSCFPYCICEKSSCPKMTDLHFYFKFANRSSIIRFLLVHPWTLIRYFGGISTSIWIWTGHNSASIIVTPFLSHIVLKIFPISFYNFRISSILYIRVQIQCDMYISICCMMNYVCPFWAPLLFKNGLVDLLLLW